MKKEIVLGFGIILLFAMMGFVSAVDCTTDADCVPATCCHPTQCVPLAQKPNCAGVTCTGFTVCMPGTLDCNQGRCLCQNGQCQALIYSTLGENITLSVFTAKDKYYVGEPIYVLGTQSAIPKPGVTGKSIIGFVIRMFGFGENE